MDSQTLSSSFNLELRLIRARNIFVKTREVFVRCYIPTTSNKRVRLDSQQISSHSNLTWNQTFSLNCSATPQTIQSLKQGTIVFELRCRSSATLVSRMSGSKLLARAEMPWNDVVEVPNEKWVVMTAKDGYVYSDDVKPPALQIATKVEEVGEITTFAAFYWVDPGFSYEPSVSRLRSRGYYNIGPRTTVVYPGIGGAGSTRSLKQGTIVFELRCRSSATLVSRMSGSKLLARAEMPWNDVVGIPDEKWVVMTAKDSYVYTDDVKPPAIQIVAKLEEVAEVKRRKEYECNYCIDYDLFPI
ncbi:hypothetical protein SASPL_153712 [Salvia splendens]|uniref:C2 domain-containing protein n=1 Tax=Salvia splendens TaxID=180675 RepID=A0A8X8VYT9_SALSN|nr:hypothetical protein SASPL_153712 [Salvia splendens]